MAKWVSEYRSTIFIIGVKWVTKMNVLNLNSTIIINDSERRRSINLYITISLSIFHIFFNSIISNSSNTVSRFHFCRKQYFYIILLIFN